MAASRTCAPTAADIAARTASRRITFAKIAEPMQAPNLLALQTESFDWLVGNEKWRARVAAANAARPGSLPETSGLEEIFRILGYRLSVEVVQALRDHGSCVTLCPRGL